jgi:ABC-2 type transport system permease protein
MKLIKIIKKEYLTIVKKKSFLISTLLTPLIMGAFIILPIIFAQISPEMHKKIAVIDFTGEIFQELTKNLNRKLKTGEPAYKLFEIKTTENEVEKVKESLREKVEKKEYYGYLILNKEIISKREAEYYSKNVSDLQTIEELKAAISDSIAKLLLQKEGIELEKIKKAMKRIELKTIKIVKGKEKKAGFLSEYFGLIFLVSLLFALILGYGMTIMRNILEEKNSRIVEVLLSSTNSFELMMGKILGIGGAGITQMVIWALLIALSIRYFSFRFPQIEFTIFGTNILIFFFIFFILGFFLFSTLFAIIGAITNTDYEAQQLAAPITWILIIPFLIAIMTTKNPNGIVSVILSFIPFFTPIVMFMRISITPPPFYEILASILLEIITIIFLIWITSKIFRIGILMYGKRPSFQELMKWIKYK